MINILGAGVSGTQAELVSDTVSDRRFQSSADFSGIYHFSGLPAGEYTLKLSSAGFKRLTVKSILILQNEQKSLPILRLGVSDPGCGYHGNLDHIRVLPSGDHFGNLSGSIRIDQGRGKSRPIAGADVTVMCNPDKICGATRTDAAGEFMFKTLPPGELSVRVNRTGFYTLNEPGYAIEEGLESVYWPIYMERCRLGNCDPRLRPKKPLATCE